MGDQEYPYTTSDLGERFLRALQYLYPGQWDHLIPVHTNEELVKLFRDIRESLCQTTDMNMTAWQDIMIDLTPKELRPEIKLDPNRRLRYFERSLDTSTTLLHEWSDPDHPNPIVTFPFSVLSSATNCMSHVLRTFRRSRSQMIAGVRSGKPYMTSRIMGQKHASFRTWLCWEMLVILSHLRYFVETVSLREQARLIYVYGVLVDMILYRNTTIDQYRLILDQQKKLTPGTVSPPTSQIDYPYQRRWEEWSSLFLYAQYKVRVNVSYSKYMEAWSMFDDLEFQQWSKQSELESKGRIELRRDWNEQRLNVCKRHPFVFWIPILAKEKQLSPAMFFHWAIRKLNEGETMFLTKRHIKTVCAFGMSCTIFPIIIEYQRRQLQRHMSS